MLIAYELAALTLGYWLFDHLYRRDRLVAALAAVGVRAWPFQRAIFGVSAVAGGIVWSWESLPEFGALRWLGTFLAAMLAWKAVTKDIDPVVGASRGVDRILLVGAAVGAYFSPAYLLFAALLLTTPFALWQHHATLPMRVLLAECAFCSLAPFAGWTTLLSDTSVLVFFVVTIQVSHYLITALAKGFLGPKWYSWVTDNRIHHLAASAYSWGWARFIAWPTWLRVIRAVKRVEVPMQLSAFGVELLAPLALLHPASAIAFCLTWSAFHVGVFSLSGLLFWDWVGTHVAIAVMIWMLPDAVTSVAFGPLPCLVALVFMLVFPLRHKLWKPMPLGWWDTPFTARMHWVAHGQSGNVYEVYNNYMCPHERIYGKVHGCFLAPVAVCTYHLGEVWKHELRDALREAGPHPERLDEVRETWGVSPRSDEMAERHRRYLKAFFGAINRGERKHVLPAGLRWLKAPGGQCFYWGELPAYRGQEPVDRIAIHYREEYFDGRELRRIRDQLIEEIPVDETSPAGTVSEPTPKELDDFLLSFAAGKLIDLPGVGDGYVGGDDGKRAV